MRAIWEFDDIDLDTLENRMMDRPHQAGRTGRDYLTPLEYWEMIGEIIRR